MKNKQKVPGAVVGATGQDGTADFAPSPEGSGEPGSTGTWAGAEGGSCAGSPGWLWRPKEPAAPLLVGPRRAATSAA